MYLKINEKCIGKTFYTSKIFLVMKMTGILLTVACLQVSAGAFSQTISFSKKNVSLSKVFSVIQRQSGYLFFYNNVAIKDVGNTDVDFNHASVREAMNLALKDKPLTYTILDKYIVVSRKLDNFNKASDAAIADTSIKVYGKVTSTGGEILPGVTIRVKGTTAGTTTNNEGLYSMTVSPNAVLAFSFLGFGETDVPVKGQSVINMVMRPATTGLNQLVVVGYGTQKKENVLGAISSINSEQIENIPTSDLSNVLAGRLSGTYVETNTGTPGIGSSVRIRAQTSWNGGSPVYVIDGVVRDKTSFDALDPNEVASITVLKDAASTAIYGSRAANGVILVTTKSGESGKPVISFSTLVTENRPERMPKYMSVPASIALDRYVYGDSSVTAADVAAVDKFNPNGRAWYNAAYQNPTTQTYSLNASGGGKTVTYFMEGDYYNEHGFLPNVWYKKYNLRGKISAKLTRDLTVDLNLAESNGTRNRFNFTYDFGSSDLNNLWGKLLYQSGFTQPYVNGNPVNPGWLGNVIEMMRSGGYWRDQIQLNDALVNITYKLPFVPGLFVKVSYSRNLDNNYVVNFAKKQLLYNYQTISPNGVVDPSHLLGTQLSGDPGTPYLGNEQGKTDSYQLNGQVNYDRQFGKNHISAVLVYEQYESQYNYFSMYHYNFPLVPIDQFFATSSNPDDWSTSGNESQDGRLSYIGRVEYNYADKYLITASAREDGSIKFAPDKRWGFFPSVSAGWIISHENFFKNSKASDIIDFLKLRASFGSTGNDAIGGWQWQDHYDIGGGYYVGGTQQPGLNYAGIPNPNITWEKTHAYNAGFDVDFLENFSLTTNFWFEHTYDILGPRILAIPSTFGGSLPAVNYGIVNGRGLEVDLGYKNKAGEFSYAVNGNFGLATTKVIKRDVAANAPAYRNPNGRPLGYLYGYDATGIYRTQADLDKLPAGFTINGQAPVLGMLAYKDISSPNGKPDGKIDSYDQAVLANYGQGQAPVSYGLDLNFEYKGITLDALFAGLAGFKLFYNDAFGRNIGVYVTHTAWWENYYTPKNVSTASMPKPFPWGDSRADYTYNSSFNLYNGSFVRLKDLSIGYNLPLKVSKRLGTGSINVFASGTNLFLLSKFKFYDPEVYQFMSYPIMSTFSLGVRITL